MRFLSEPLALTNEAGRETNGEADFLALGAVTMKVVLSWVTWLRRSMVSQIELKGIWQSSLKIKDVLKRLNIAILILSK